MSSGIWTCVAESSGGSGEVRIWQNMGPKNTADNQDHSTSCDSGYLASGLRVYISGALDGFMIAHCTKSSLSLSGSTIKTGPAVNADNQFHNVFCDDNQIVRSITVYASGSFDGNIRLNCGTLTGASLDNSNPIWADYFYGGINNNLYTSDLNAVLDNSVQIVDCPNGYVATGIRAYASSNLENFDLYCKKIV